MRRNVLSILLGLCSLPALAAEWQVIHAGVLYADPARSPQREATLVIRDGRVLAVHRGYRTPGDLPEVPADTGVIDLRNQHVLPGLIDSHVHLTSDLGGNEALLAGVRLNVADQAYDAAVNARKTLAAGFTTVRNLGDDDGVTLALRDAIAAGKMPGPRILDAGQGISATAGHADGRLGLREELREAVGHGNLCDGADDCRRAVRAQIARGVDLIKITTTGGVNSRIGAGLGIQMFNDEVQALIDTARMYGRKVAVHAHGNDGIHAALRFGAASIEHGTLMEADSIALFKQSGAYYVPTLSTINGYKERLAANPQAYTGEVLKKIEWRIGITGKSLRAAHAAGVKIAFGTDAGVSRHGRNADEFELMVQHGMSAQEALVAATIHAADLLGLAGEIGCLNAGCAADLVAVAGDPTANVGTLKSPALVMKAGKVFTP